MKKISYLIASFVLMAGVFTSCDNGAPSTDSTNSTEQNEGDHEHPHGEDGHEHPHGEPGHEHPHGDKDHRKGPPGKGGHNPEQTKTLEEIGGYQMGDVATDFALKNVDGETFSLSQIEGAKGYIVVFTCNGCPFSKMYEDRLISLHNEYAPKGYSVVAINPNVSPDNETESFEAMQTRATEKEFPFVYLADENHDVFPQYGAVRTPHVFLLDGERKVQYIGTIDNNAKSEEDVTVNYVEDAIMALENGTKPDPNFTKAIGCPIKSH